MLTTASAAMDAEACSLCAERIDDCLLSQGKHEEAIRHYAAALALDKWRPEIWTSRGMAYYCVGEYESAVRDFTR